MENIKKSKISDMDTVTISSDGESLEIIDQTLLPLELKILKLKHMDEIWDAIKTLKVRGAPAIGVAAAIGIYLRAYELRKVIYEGINVNDESFKILKFFNGNQCDLNKLDEYEKFKYLMADTAEYLKSARPTAVNLQWAVDRMMSLLKNISSEPIDKQVSILRTEAESIKNQDIEICKKIGEYGLTLLKPEQGILTHCNAGHLATVRYGTATAPIYLGQERGYQFKVYVDETRPLLQGARLTSFELQEAGVDVTLICDNMAATLMKQGKIDAVITGCDRVAANGDGANKIGTLGVAIMAKYFNIPFYLAAPSSTIDFKTGKGSEIVIEERDSEEIRSMWYKKPMVPRDVKIFNPSFDVTDNTLISGIITEYGIAYPPYDISLKKIIER